MKPSELLTAIEIRALLHLPPGIDEARGKRFFRDNHNRLILSVARLVPYAKSTSPGTAERRKPRRVHYLECPECESCFKVAKDITSVPAHKCWAEEKAIERRAKESRLAEFDREARELIAAGGFDIEAYARAGSPAAFELIGPHDKGEAICERCGVPIKDIFMTPMGPLGGDCLATLTGDDSTRQAIRRLRPKLEKIKAAHPDAALHLEPNSRRERYQDEKFIYRDRVHKTWEIIARWGDGYSQHNIIATYADEDFAHKIFAMALSCWDT